MDQLTYFFSKPRIDDIKRSLLEIVERDDNYINKLAGQLCVEDLLDIITEYRKEKKWAEADEIRDWLLANGFKVEMYKWGGMWASNSSADRHYTKTVACGWNSLARDRFGA